MKLGEKIKKLRKSKKFTQTDLAERLGVHVNTLLRWENGKRFPNIEKIKKIADVLGTTVSYLTDDMSEMCEMPLQTKGIDFQRIDNDKRDFSFTEKLINSNKMIVYDTPNGRFFIPATSEGFDFVKGMSSTRAIENLALAK